MTHGNLNLSSTMTTASRNTGHLYYNSSYAGRDVVKSIFNRPRISHPSNLHITFHFSNKLTHRLSLSKEAYTWTFTIERNLHIHFTIERNLHIDHETYTSMTLCREQLSKLCGNVLACRHVSISEKVLFGSL